MLVFKAFNQIFAIRITFEYFILLKLTLDLDVLLIFHKYSDKHLVNLATNPLF